MTEQIRENYFLTVKTFFVLFIEIYLLLIRQAQAGISGGIFLLMALFFGLFIGQALTEKKGFRMFFLLVATGELVLLVFWYGKMFLRPAYCSDMRLSLPSDIGERSTGAFCGMHCRYFLPCRFAREIATGILSLHCLSGSFICSMILL